MGRIEERMGDFMKSASFQTQRERLVNKTLPRQGIRDESVLEAVRLVPREEFVPDDLRDAAYRNIALPLSDGQTISQPLIVAQMLELLKLGPDDCVLEVGTGSGYAAAVMSRLARQVYSVERVRDLSLTAINRLRRLGFDNVHVRHGDGSLGWSEYAPFNAISVAASGPTVPLSLLSQLKIGGRLVMPVGPDPNSQNLTCTVRLADNDYQCHDLGLVRFVPLIGKEGWRSEKLADSTDPSETQLKSAKEQ